MKGYFYRNIKGLTYRYHWNTDGYDIDVRVNDAFASAHGFKDLGSFLADDDATPFDNLVEKYGRVPDYLPLRTNGQDSDIVRIGKQIEAYRDCIKKL